MFSLPQEESSVLLALLCLLGPSIIWRISMARFRGTLRVRLHRAELGCASGIHVTKTRSQSMTDAALERDGKVFSNLGFTVHGRQRGLRNHFSWKPGTAQDVSKVGARLCKTEIGSVSHVRNIISVVGLTRGAATTRGNYTRLVHNKSWWCVIKQIIDQPLLSHGEQGRNVESWQVEQ